MFIIRDRETGTEIDFFDNLADAQSMLKLFEESDKRDGIYEPNFYEIYNTETDEEA